MAELVGEVVVGGGGLPSCDVVEAEGVVELAAVALLVAAHFLGVVAGAHGGAVLFLGELWVGEDGVEHVQAAAHFVEIGFLTVGLIDHFNKTADDGHAESGGVHIGTALAGPGLAIVEPHALLGVDEQPLAAVEDATQRRLEVVAHVLVAAVDGHHVAVADDEAKRAGIREVEWHADDVEVPLAELAGEAARHDVVEGVEVVAGDDGTALEATQFFPADELDAAAAEVADGVGHAARRPVAEAKEWLLAAMQIAVDYGIALEVGEVGVARLDVAVEVAFGGGLADVVYGLCPVGRDDESHVKLKIER